MRGSLDSLSSGQPSGALACMLLNRAGCQMKRKSVLNAEYIGNIIRKLTMQCYSSTLINYWL